MNEVIGMGTAGLVFILVTIPVLTFAFCLILDISIKATIGYTLIAALISKTTSILVEE